MLLDDSIAASAERTFVIEAPATLGTLDYLTPDRSSTRTCGTVAGTPTLSWRSVPGAGRTGAAVANDAELPRPSRHLPAIFTTPPPRSSFLDSPGRRGLLLVRPPPASTWP